MCEQCLAYRSLKSLHLVPGLDINPVVVLFQRESQGMESRICFSLDQHLTLFKQGTLSMLTLIRTKSFVCEPGAGGGGSIHATTASRQTPEGDHAQAVRRLASD